MYDPGKCTVVCPACPQPGRNLPDGWEHDPDRLCVSFNLQLSFFSITEYRWLYALFLAIDTNFRLKRKLVVEEGAYKEYLQGYNIQEEVVSQIKYNGAQ